MRHISRFAVAVVIMLPFAAGAATVEELRAQAQELLNRLNALQGQSGATYTGVTVDSSACPLIGRSLKLGASGDDVTRLQQFLGRDASVYPERLVTGYYGSLTEAAVKRWQVKYNIVSSGNAASTGYGVVGPRTAAAISLQCSQYGGSGGATGADVPVGGFIQVTPVSGAAPLSIAVQATVNTVNSCGGATYTLDYGDGTVPSSIAVPVGACQQQTQTLGHTYIYGGTYLVTLSAGGHRTTATVQVFGPAAPVPVPGVPVKAGDAIGKISTSVTSGTAPFNATFYVSCVNATAFNVSFGDGTDLGSAGVSKSVCDGSLQAVSHTYTSAGTYTARLVLFVKQLNGTTEQQDKESVVITVKTGSDGSGGTLNPMTVTPGVGGNPFATSVSVDGGCSTYTLNWGDGTTASSGSCSTSAMTFNHTYALTGSYTITLTRGSQTDTASIVIQ